MLLDSTRQKAPVEPFGAGSDFSIRRICKHYKLRADVFSYYFNSRLLANKLKLKDPDVARVIDANYMVTKPGYEPGTECLIGICSTKLSYLVCRHQKLSATSGP